MQTRLCMALDDVTRCATTPLRTRMRMATRTHLDEAVEHHVEQVADHADVAPDLGLDARVHLHFVDRHGDELVQDQVHFLLLHLVGLFAEPVKNVIITLSPFQVKSIFVYIVYTTF